MEERQELIEWLREVKVWEEGELTPGNLTKKLCTGVSLAKLVDLCWPDSVDWAKIANPASNKFKMLSNCSYLFEVLKKKQLPGLEALSPREFVDGNYATISTIFKLLQPYILVQQDILDVEPEYLDDTIVSDESSSSLVEEESSVHTPRMLRPA